MEWLAPALRALGEGSPWLILVATVLSGVIWFGRSLASGRLYTREQVERSRVQWADQTAHEREQYTQRLREARDDCDYWRRLALSGTRIAESSLAMAKESAATLQAVSPAVSAQPGPAGHGGEVG